MICIPLKVKDPKELLLKFNQAQKKADLVEIWFDYLKRGSSDTIQKIFQKKKKPIIYKNSKLQKQFLEILKLEPEYLDLDISTNQKLINQIKKTFPKTKIITSYHNFKTTPPNSTLEKIVKKMKTKKTDIFKIATNAKSLDDSLRILEFLNKLSRKHKAICICMGKYGRITRATGHLLGNYLMYAPLDQKTKTAQGQISYMDLKKIQDLI